jgi:hypothetical protein
METGVSSEGVMAAGFVALFAGLIGYLVANRISGLRRVILVSPAINPTFDQRLVRPVHGMLRPCPRGHSQRTPTV